MIEYWDRLKLAMDAKALRDKVAFDITQLSDSMPVTYQAVAKVKNGGAFGAKNNIRAAKILGVNSEWLATGQGVMSDVANTQTAEIGITRVPLISSVQAGIWTEIIDNFHPGDADDWLLTDSKISKGSFALEIKGRSMLPVFKEGDRVIIDPDVLPNPGDYVVGKNGGEEATFKKYRPRGIDAQGHPVFELIPLNDDFETIRSDMQPIRIVGTMVEHRTYRSR